MKYWIYFKTNTLIPINETFKTKQEGLDFVKLIKKGLTIYRTDLKYTVKH